MSQTASTTTLTVVASGRAGQQNAADAWLARTPAGSRAILAEGAAVAPAAPEDTASIALGAGCPCCVGFVALQVALTRLIRSRRPAHLLLLLADRRHLDGLATRLAQVRFGIELEVRIDDPVDAVEAGDAG